MNLVDLCDDLPFEFLAVFGDLNGILEGQKSGRIPSNLLNYNKYENKSNITNNLNPLWNRNVLNTNNVKGLRNTLLN